MFSPVWWLIGCSSADWCTRFNIECEEQSGREDPVDADEDVWPADQDCDDLDPYSYPGAPELCDNVDNDCDGVDDIGEGIAQWLYADDDRDGFGNTDQPRFHCVADALPEGWVLDDTDCDDTRPYVYPGAGEICDEMDTDCDGEIDEGVEVTYTIDADGDGDGSSAEGAKTTQGCTPPDGYSYTAEDCDDTDADRSSYTPEVCDFIDNNCNEQIDEAQCSDELDRIGLMLSGEVSEDRAGNALSGLGDVNGDGYDDIAIGAHRYDGSSDDNGALYVVFGPLSADLDLADAPLRLEGDQESDQLGRAVDRVGDVNGDGLDDLLVGASSGSDSYGQAYLLHGPLSADTVLTDAALTITGVGEQDYLGRSVAGLGDIDGDGLSDFAAGAWGSDAGAIDAGAIYVFSGLSAGDLTADDADGTVLSVGSGDYAGWAIAGAGDFNGDGHADLAVGGYSARESAGIAWVVLGPISGESSLFDAQASLYGGEGDHVGWALDGAGDVDGDGRSELLVGAPRVGIGNQSRVGSAWVVHGPMTGTLPLTITGPSIGGDSAFDYAGFAVSGIGDRDGDGLAEVLIGAYGADTEAANAGSAHLFRSDGRLPASGSVFLAGSDWGLHGGEPLEEAGVAVDDAGDVNGDGRNDLLIGAPERDGTGAAYLVY